MMLLRDTPESASVAYKTKTWNQLFNVNQKKMIYVQNTNSVQENNYNVMNFIGQPKFYCNGHS